jgi:hypothetical protein
VSILTAAAFSAKEHISLKIAATEIPAALPILVGALMTWFAFCLMDHLRYHRLLHGAVAQRLKVDGQLKDRVPGIGVAESIGRASSMKLRVREISSSSVGF